MGKRFATKQERYDTVESFFRSGESQMSWCKENGVASSTLYRWMKEYKQNHKEVKFVPLEPKAGRNTQTERSFTPDSEAVLIEIGSCKIHMPKHIAMPFIKELIKEVTDTHVQL